MRKIVLINAGTDAAMQSGGAGLYVGDRRACCTGADQPSIRSTPARSVRHGQGTAPWNHRSQAALPSQRTHPAPHRLPDNDDEGKKAENENVKDKQDEVFSVVLSNAVVDPASAATVSCELSRGLGFNTVLLEMAAGRDWVQQRNRSLRQAPFNVRPCKASFIPQSCTRHDNHTDASCRCSPGAVVVQHFHAASARAAVVGAGGAQLLALAADSPSVRKRFASLLLYLLGRPLGRPRHHCRRGDNACDKVGRVSGPGAQHGVPAGWRWGERGGAPAKPLD